jgi:hypothetical protein
MVIIFQSLWSIITNILENYTHLDEIVEATCRIVKHSIRSLDTNFHPYIEQFLNIVIIAYQVILNY